MYKNHPNALSEKTIEVKWQQMPAPFLASDIMYLAALYNPVKIRSVVSVLSAKTTIFLGEYSLRYYFCMTQNTPTDANVENYNDDECGEEVCYF